MSYFTDHLAWQQRVNQQINASNKLNQQQSASQSPIPQMRSTTGFSVGHSNPSGMVNQEPLAGSKQDFVIVTPDGGLQMRSRQGARNSTPSKTSSSKINQALYAFGGKTSVRGNDMYDFMRNKYRPLSSKKNAQRYHYGRATSQDRTAHIYSYAKNSPLARTSYQQNFQNSATQLPQPYHPRPTEAVQKQRKKQNSVEEEDKPHRFNEDWKNVYNPGGSKSRSVYSKRTISQAMTPSAMQHHHHQQQREYSPTGLLIKKASPTYSQQMSHSNLKTSNSSHRDKIINQLSKLPDSDLEKIGHALRIDTSENFDDTNNNVQINPTTIEEKKPKAANKSGMITKENLDKLNEVQGLQNIQGGASELDEQQNADKIEELKQNEVKKSRIGGGSVLMSESRVSIGKSTYTYLNSLEQRLEDEKNAREKLEKELEFIKKELSTTSHSRK